MLRYGIVTLALLATLGGCTPENSAPAAPPPEANPAAPGFDQAGSDPRAVALADSVVLAHGGRAAYDTTRFLSWNFFGARTLHWDKRDRRVRIDFPARNTVYLLNYGGEEPAGRVQRDGAEITHPDSLAKYLAQAQSIFINDSYWLVQPFKLKDSGVTLGYGGEVAADSFARRPSYVLDLRFDGVGDTPQNKYRLFVDRATHRINTWEFYREATDETPRMVTPHRGYQDYHGVLISGDRGGRFQLTDVRLGNELPESTFSEF